MRPVFFLASALAIGTIGLPIAIEKRVIVTAFDFEVKTITVFVTASPPKSAINSTSISSLPLSSSSLSSSLSSSSSSSSTASTVTTTESTIALSFTTGLSTTESNITESTIAEFNITASITSEANTTATAPTEVPTSEVPTSEVLPLEVSATGVATADAEASTTEAESTTTEAESSKAEAEASTTTEAEASATVVPTAEAKSPTTEAEASTTAEVEASTTEGSTAEASTTEGSTTEASTAESSTMRSSTTQVLTTAAPAPVITTSSTMRSSTTQVLTTAAPAPVITTSSPRRLRPSRRPNPNAKPGVRVRVSTVSTKVTVVITRTPFISTRLSTFLTKVPASTPGPNIKTTPTVSNAAIPQSAPVFDSVHPTGEIQATLSSGPDFQAAVLYHHNVARANHGAPPLIWDAECEAGAKRAAATCIFEHPSFLKDLHQGQNIFAVSGDVFNVTAGITESWYKSELASMEPYWGVNSIPATDFGKVGHLTAMLWKGTTKVGCVAQDCGDRMKLKDGTLTGMNKFFVCNYAPPGNYAGEYAANVQPPIDPSKQGSWSD